MANMPFMRRAFSPPTRRTAAGQPWTSETTGLEVGPTRVLAHAAVGRGPALEELARSLVVREIAAKPGGVELHHRVGALVPTRVPRERLGTGVRAAVPVGEEGRRAGHPVGALAPRLGEVRR